MYNVGVKNQPEEYWKNKLTPEQYHLLREKGTEPAFTGVYVDNHEQGMYHCAACGVQLFSSEAKFDSGSGWPSFWEVADPKAVEFHDDNSLGMKRTEITCAKCGSHLGHIFDDGPNPTGQRYCVNSGALAFKPNKPV